MHTQKSRLHVLDLLRGILFLNMAAYHFLYDWVFLFGQSCPFMNTQAAFLWQQMICSGFILLAGCCCTLSRNPAKHGVQILGCGLVITLVTVFITPQEQILFGILHFTGLAYLHHSLSAAYRFQITGSARLRRCVSVICIYKGNLLRLSRLFAHTALVLTRPVVSVSHAVCSGAADTGLLFRRLFSFDSLVFSVPYGLFRRTCCTEIKTLYQDTAMVSAAV